MSDASRDWRERWEPFAIAFVVLVGLVVVAGLLVFGTEWVRLKWR